MSLIKNSKMILNASSRQVVDLWEFMLRPIRNMIGHGMENSWAHISKVIPSNPNVKKGEYFVVDKNHLASDSLPDRFERTDEFYSFKNISHDIKVLVKIDEKTYTGGTNGDNHPMAWYHEFDGGRAFYTAMGHTDETYSEPLFLTHLAGGIKYVLGW